MTFKRLASFARVFSSGKPARQWQPAKAPGCYNQFVPCLLLIALVFTQTRASPDAGLIHESSSLLPLAPKLTPTLEATRFIEPFTLGDDALWVEVPHSFTRAEARVRMQQLLEYWWKRFEIANQWRDDRAWLDGHVIGTDVRAIFEVRDHSVLVRAEDPGATYRNSGRGYVEKKLKKYLHPTYREP